MGTYRLRPGSEELYCRATDKPQFPKSIIPEDIVGNLENGLANVIEQVKISIYLEIKFIIRLILSVYFSCI